MCSIIHQEAQKQKNKKKKLILLQGFEKPSDCICKELLQSVLLCIVDVCLLLPPPIMTSFMQTKYTERPNMDSFWVKRVISFS